MSKTIEIEGREDCPVINSHCIYYGYQYDSFGFVAIEVCGHPDNPTETEGNCTEKLCPIYQEYHNE